MAKRALEAQALANLAVKALQEKKGKSILSMDLRKSDGSVSDFFVVCTGTSDTHVQALADSVLTMMKQEAREIAHSKEGMQSGQWILLDYITVVIHIFLKDRREFYRLERLWGDATMTSYEDG